MPKDKGPQWHHIRCDSHDESKPGNLLTGQCLYSDKKFVGGAFRIPGHLIGNKNIGLKPCPSAQDAVVSQFSDIENK